MATPFDRFSVPARQVMAQAQEEARSLGHNYLGTEHVLVALASQPQGAAAAVLAALSVDHEALRGAVVRIIGRGSALACGSMQMTPRLKRVLERAGKEAKQTKSACVEPEHLLIALTTKDGSVASGILHELRVTPARIREVLPAARAGVAQQASAPVTGTRRYTLVFPEELFGQVEQLAAAEHTTVVELLRRFTKLGLMAAAVQKEPGSALLIRDGEGERQIVLL
jgi:ATP-dependent Clp protease ATP-binding subunit ClpA